MSSQLLEISENAIISPTQGQISSELGDEAVILNLDSGVYYGLNEVGARVWELIQQPQSFSELLRVLLEEYDVSMEACRHDLTTMLLDLKSADLVEVSNETP